jgi:excisionase family DNA binding protein
MINTNCEKEQVLVQGEDPKLLSVKRAAAILNVSAHCLYRKIKSGEIPGYKFGRKVLVDLQEIKDAMRIKKEIPRSETN